jgi:hypothetical protein
MNVVFQTKFRGCFSGGRRERTADHWQEIRRTSLGLLDGDKEAILRRILAGDPLPREQERIRVAL